MSATYNGIIIKDAIVGTVLRKNKNGKIFDDDLRGIKNPSGTTSNNTIPRIMPLENPWLNTNN